MTVITNRNEKWEISPFTSNKPFFSSIVTASVLLASKICLENRYDLQAVILFFDYDRYCSSDFVCYSCSSHVWFLISEEISPVLFQHTNQNYIRNGKILPNLSNHRSAKHTETAGFVHCKKLFEKGNKGKTRTFACYLIFTFFASVHWKLQLWSSYATVFLFFSRPLCNHINWTKYCYGIHPY